MSEQTETAAAGSLRDFAALLLRTGASINQTVLQDATRTGDHAVLAVVPPEHNVQDVTALVEKHLPQPSRVRGLVALHTLDAWIEYCRAHWGWDEAERSSNAYIVAPTTKEIAEGMQSGPGRFVCVFNDESWADHRAVFQPAVSEPWDTWSKASRKPMGQVEFAEFLEDRVDDIKEPHGADLITLIDNFSAVRSATFGSKVSRVNGSVKLTYNDETSTGDLVLPETFTLGIPVFDGGPSYAVKARLRYRFGGGAVAFSIPMVRPDLVVLDALEQMEAQARDALERVYRGVPVGSEERLPW